MPKISDINARFSNLLPRMEFTLFSVWIHFSQCLLCLKTVIFFYLKFQQFCIESVEDFRRFSCISKMRRFS